MNEKKKSLQRGVSSFNEVIKEEKRLSGSPMNRRMSKLGSFKC